MRRRGNKSSKVPNVKLRPAQPGAYRSALSFVEIDQVCVQDSQLRSDDTSVYDTCPRPFAGVVLCATGITDKPGLFKQAVELGATTNNAFTDRVTHLIAVQHGGAKYMCALDRKIPILTPEWISSSYHIWLHGDDVDLEQSILQNRLPIFSNVVLCPSGIPDIVRRTQINKIITAQGGTYVKDIKRPVRVTHLLCSGDEETDKMHYAEKFNKAGEANIKLVWEEWFWDCLEFGGRFDEDRYTVEKPRPKPRKSVREGDADPPIPDSSHAQSGTQNAPERQGPAKGAPGEDDGEVAAVLARRLPAVQLQMWHSLLKNRGYVVDEEGSTLIRSPTKPKPKARQYQNSSYDDTDEQDDEERENAMFRGERRSVLESRSFRRANSFAPGPTKSREAQPLRRLLSSRQNMLAPDEGVGAGAQDGEAQDMGMAMRVDHDQDANDLNVDTPGAGPSTVAPVPADAPAGQTPPLPAHVPTPKKTTPSTFAMFSGLRFAALGEADSANVREAIAKAGGIFVETTSDLRDVVAKHDTVGIDVIVVRLVSGSKIFSSLSSPTSSSALEALKPKFRTECWLERCLYEERLCGAEDHVSFTPVDVRCPIRGAEKVFISFSGLDDAERYFMTRLVKVLGLTLLPTFSKRATHLLCPSAEGLKFQKAREWGVPVVGMPWVEEMKHSGRVPGVEGFLVAPLVQPQPQTQPQTLSQPKQTKSDANLDANAKGKGKAKDSGDAGMNDITNSQAQSQTQEDSQPWDPCQEPDSMPPIPLPQAQSGREQRPPVSAVPSLSQLNIADRSFGKPASLLLSSTPKGLAPGPRRTDSSVTDPEPRELGIPTSVTSADEPPHPNPHAPNLPDLPQDKEFQFPSESQLYTSTPRREQPGGSGHVSCPPFTGFDAENSAFAPMPIPAPVPPVDHLMDVVPSSNTPSPMKAPAAPAPVPVSRQTSGASLGKQSKGKGRALTRTKSSSISPSKYYPPAQPVDAEKTKALQESLTSLLGKRRSDESGSGDSTGRDGARRRGDRVDGKRVRSTRSKSSITSNESNNPVAINNAPFDAYSGPGPADDDLAGFGFGFDSLNGESPMQTDSNVQEESMRVTYEDPVQRDERRKLLKLFESQEGDDDTVEIVGYNQRVAATSAKAKAGAGSVKPKQTSRKAPVPVPLNAGGEGSKRRSTRKSGGPRG